MTNTLKSIPELRIGEADLALLVRMSGLRVPAGDLARLRMALRDHILATEILLAADLAQHAPAVGARWHV
ncbi:MAG: hypothetical protein AB7F09_08145 [Parvibaculaceae bacterium]